MTTNKNYLFTSESVNEGHPDKIADQVSDSILDAALSQDPDAKVACETATKTGMIMVFGEISTTAKLNFEEIVRQTAKDIGYDDAKKGLDYKSMNVVVALEEQSPDIAQVNLFHLFLEFVSHVLRIRVFISIVIKTMLAPVIRFVLPWVLYISFLTLVP